MAISNPTLLDSKPLQNASALNSASISPSANALLIIVHCVLASSGSGWTDAVSDSFGANLGDWSSVGVEIAGAATVHMWIHYAQCGATPGSGTVSVDPSDGIRQIMFVLELTGHNTTSPVTQYKTYSSDATPTSPEITLDSSPASGSLVLGAIVAAARLVQVTSSPSHLARLPESSWVTVGLATAAPPAVYPDATISLVSV